MKAATSEGRRESAKRIRLGIVGCGAFVALYHLPVLREDPRVRLSVICDPSPAEATRRAAAEEGIPLVDSPEAVWEACEAVLISSPHGLHAQHARAALAARRHVLVDKPFVLRSKDAHDLAAQALLRGLVNAVAFNRRFDPGSLRARAILGSGGLGPLRHIETVQLGYPRSGWVMDPALGGGGPFVGRGAHMADLVPWLTGQRPRRVKGRVVPGEPGRVDAGGFIECEFDGFACAMTILAHGLDTWDEIRVFGEEGLIELRRPVGWPLGWEMAWYGARGQRVETVAADPALGQATRNFLDALEGGATPACPFADAWLSVRVIEAAYQSAGEGGGWIGI
jgi:predicted dehydrogenase